MRKYALDSNIVSYLLKGNENILVRVGEEVIAGNEVHIPPIVYYEVKRGLLAVGATAKMKLFMDFCAESVGHIGREVLDIAADIYVTFRKAGRGADDADILIAAFCLAHGYTLVTHNTRHFEGIAGLELEDWAEGL